VSASVSGAIADVVASTGFIEIWPLPPRHVHRRVLIDTNSREPIRFPAHAAAAAAMIGSRACSAGHARSQGGWRSGIVIGRTFVHPARIVHLLLHRGGGNEHAAASAVGQRDRLLLLLVLLLVMLLSGRLGVLVLLVLLGTRQSLRGRHADAQAAQRRVRLLLVPVVICRLSGWGGNMPRRQ